MNLLDSETDLKDLVYDSEEESVECKKPYHLRRWYTVQLYYRVPYMVSIYLNISL